MTDTEWGSEWPRSVYYRMRSQKSPSGGGFNLLNLNPHSLWLPEASLLFQNSDGTGAVVPTDPVGYWAGQGSIGAILLQATAVSRPTLQSSGNLRFIQSDGSNDFLSVAFTVPLAQPFTRITAVRLLTVAIDIRLLSGKAGVPDDGQLFMSDSGDSLRMYAGNVFSVSFLPVVNTHYVFTEVYNGASSKFAADLGAYSIGDAGANALGGMSMFALAGGGNPSHGQISASIIIPGVISDSARTQVVKDFALRQGRVL